MIFSELIMISNQIRQNLAKDVFDIYVFSRVTMYVYIYTWLYMYNI